MLALSRRPTLKRRSLCFTCSPIARLLGVQSLSAEQSAGMADHQIYDNK